MDSTEWLLTPPTSLAPWSRLTEAALGKRIEKWRADETDGASERTKKQVAKDFESILISKLLDEAKNTLGHWGFDQDGASKQVQGLFWLYLARDIADKGGFGLWKDLYESVMRQA
jgi:Rod binding domain-containing protein